MPGRARSVGAASRHAGSSGGTGGPTPNNSPAFVLWGGGPAGPIGDPYNNNGPQSPLSEAKLVEWRNERMVAGGGWTGFGPQLETVVGNDYYNTDGTVPASPETSFRSWHQQSLKLNWGSSNKNWWTRTAELGMSTYVGFSTHSQGDPSHAFGTTWENNVTWGASTVAGALTPTAGSRLADLTSLCKAAVSSGANYRGVFMDLETSDGGSGGFVVSYAGMPVGQSEATTRSWVTLRAMQMEKVISTWMPGAEIGCYYDRSTGSWDELLFYMTQGGAQTDHVYDFTTYDSFAAGLAAGVSKYTQVDASFYRSAGAGTLAPDNGLTQWGNAYSFNMGRRYARQSYLLSLSSLTSAQKLASMRNTYRAGFLWPTAGGPPAAEGPVPTPAEFQVMVRETVRWSNGGKFFVYAQNLSDDPTYGGSSTYTKDHGPYEAGWQAECVSAVAQSTTPTASITQIDGVANPGATTYSTSSSSVIVQLTASDPFAIWRGEWANATTGASGCCTSTWVNDSGANWNPLDGSKLPSNSALGRIQCHVTLLTEAIPLAAGVNVLTFPVYNIHSLSTTVTLTVTSSSILGLFQSRYPATGAEIWVDGTLGNDGFAGTPASPKATIQAAINVSVAGSKIMVRPYAPGYATITFAGHSGTASNYIQLIASGATSMFSPGAKINCNGGAGSGSAGVSMIGNNNNFIAMWGFEVTGLNSSSAPYEVGVMPGNGAHDVAVWGCYFHDLASHAVAAPGAGGQGWQGVDRIDVCYNRITRTSRWNPYQGSGISMISQANLAGAWADGYRNHIIGNVIDGVFTDPNAPNLTPNFITDGNSIIFDISGGYAGRTLVAHNVTVGAGGRGIHTLSFNGIDAWFNTSCDSIQNLPGTWVGEFSIQDSSDCRFGWNVGAAKVGSNRVGNFQNPGTSTWSDTVFLRGTGGSEGNDPSVNSFNNINKTQVGPANYFNQYQQGVYQQTVITNVAGFRPKLAQVVTGNPPANVRAAVSPWPDALGVLRPASGPWAYGAFEAA